MPIREQIIFVHNSVQCKPWLISVMCDINRDSNQGYFSIDFLQRWSLFDVLLHQHLQSQTLHMKLIPIN